MITTASAINSFEKIVKQHAARKVGDTSEILEHIERIKHANPPVYDETKIKTFLGQRAKSLSVLIDNYYVAKLTAQFPLLDNSIFDLKRYLTIDNGVIVGDSTSKPDHSKTKKLLQVIQTGLFVHGPMDHTRRIEVAKYRKTQKKTITLNSYGDKTTRNITLTTNITAAVPEAPLATAELGRKAIGVYYGILAEILSNSTTSDLFALEETPTLETMWIPTPHSLQFTKVKTIKVLSVEKSIPKPQSYDPALLLKHRDRYYVVGLWDINDELPFEATLREFTVGPVKFPAKTETSK